MRSPAPLRLSHSPRSLVMRKDHALRLSIASQVMVSIRFPLYVIKNSVQDTLAAMATVAGGHPGVSSVRRRRKRCANRCQSRRR